VEDEKMVLNKGEKVHVITRRLFDNDLRRHFVGEVEAVSEVAVRLAGYVFVFDPGNNQYVKRPERRVRIIGLADSGSIINVLPQHVDLDALSYQMSAQDRSVLTDGSSFSLDINEFSAMR
jgi:hypothetical protein